MSLQSFNVAVVGAGAAGIAAVGVLLAQKVPKILWIDPNFAGGRMPLYTQVPSNTKVRIFREFVQKCDAFKQFEGLPVRSENPLAHYEGLDPEKTCSLELCLKKLLTLIHDIRKYHSSNVTFSQGVVTSLTQEPYKDSTKWRIRVQIENTIEETLARAVIFATGSRPRYFPESLDFARRFGARSEYGIYSPENVDLDTALDPRLLSERVTSDDVIGVIGSSHSSMVVIKNLVELKHSPKKIVCLYIEELKFAEYMPEGWILHDNTGLKGDVAEWVKNSLLKGKVPKVEMVLIDKEQKALKEKIPTCNKIIYTVGFVRNPLPKIVLCSGLNSETTVDEKNITYNNKTSEIQILEGSNRKIVEGLYGYGIAWPEQTTDPRGNVEFAVGLKKFIDYSNRMIPNVVIKHLRMQEFATSVSNLLKTSKGRDKICGVLQYLADFYLSCHKYSSIYEVQQLYENNMIMSAKLAGKIKNSMSNARKIFRFLNFLGELKKLQMALKSKRSWGFKLMFAVMYTSSFFYYIFDNSLWAINIGNLTDLISEKTQAQWKSVKNTFSMIRICVVLLKIVILTFIREKEVTFDESSLKICQTLIKLRARQRDDNLEFVLSIARAVLLLKSLKFATVENYRIFVSFCGLLASATTLICTICNKPEVVKLKRGNKKEEKIESFTSIPINNGKSYSRKNSKLLSASNLITLYSEKHK